MFSNNFEEYVSKTVIIVNRLASRGCYKNTKNSK